MLGSAVSGWVLLLLHVMRLGVSRQWSHLLDGFFPELLGLVRSRFGLVRFRIRGSILRGLGARVAMRVLEQSSLQFCLLVSG